jgi:hypothetical protein
MRIAAEKSDASGRRREGDCQWIEGRWIDGAGKLFFWKPILLYIIAHDRKKYSLNRVDSV